MSFLNRSTVKNMTIFEKISTMEVLWEDLCHNANSIESPDWHLEILNDRKSAIRDGMDTFMDWEEAKKTIKDTTR